MSCWKIWIRLQWVFGIIIREMPIGNQSGYLYWSRVRFRFRSDVFFPLLLLLLLYFFSTPPEVVVNIADLFPHPATNVVTAGSLPPALSYLSYLYICYLHHHYTPNLTWTSIWKSKFTPTLPTSPLLLWFYAFPPLFIFSPPASPIWSKELSCCPQGHRVFISIITYGRGWG